MAYGSEVEKLERRWMENPMGVSFAPLAEAYRRAGDQPRALEVLAIGLANHPAYVPALIVQARCHLDVRSDGAAEESFMAVLATDGHNLIALKGLADICERSDRPEQATRHLDRLLEADPTHDEGRAQMDRLTGVILERERLRGGATGADTVPVPELSVADAEHPEPAEPMGFEPTDAGSQGDSLERDDSTFTVDSLVDTGEEPALEAPEAGGDPPRSELELVESVGWESSEAEPVTGLESTESDFVVERDSSPFEAEETSAPASLGNADAIVPFEEESPAPWLDESPDEPMGDASRDEVAVELPTEADPPSSEAEPENDSPVTEAEAPPALADSVWAPMGSAWASEGVLQPSSEALPSVDEVRAEESPWEETSAAEPASEREEDPEVPGERFDTVPAWEASTDTHEDPPVAEPSSTSEYTEPVEPANGEDAASEAAPAALEAADEVALVEGAESELPADAEPEIEPALILTETMARLFERQGHRTMALAIYAQLAEQAPENPDLAAAVERLTGELSAGSGPSGTPGKGDAEAAAVDAIVGRGASGPAHKQNRAPSDSPEAGLRLDAPATRASEDLFSLSAVFGPARPGPAAQSTVFAPGTEAADREPSFDEFFGSEESAASDGGQAARAGGEDLEQFTAWLRSLKR